MTSPDLDMMEIRRLWFGMTWRHRLLLDANRLNIYSPQREVRKALRQVSWRR